MPACATQEKVARPAPVCNLFLPVPAIGDLIKRTERTYVEWAYRYSRRIIFVRSGKGLERPHRSAARRRRARARGAQSASVCRTAVRRGFGTAFSRARRRRSGGLLPPAEDAHSRTLPRTAQIRLARRIAARTLAANQPFPSAPHPNCAPTVSPSGENPSAFLQCSAHGGKPGVFILQTDRLFAIRPL